MSTINTMMTMNKEDDSLIHEDHAPVTTCHPLSVVLGILCCPITMCSCYTIQERESAILLTYGKYAGTVSQPGIHFANVWGRDLRKISTKVISVDLPHTKVVDKNGNPLLISGVLTYQFVNVRKALLDVENANQFVYTQAQAALKQIVSRYPYESDEHNHHSLKSESAEIGMEMVQILQSRVNISGTKIHSFAFNEISYAPEIAAGMLKRQQAAATVAARKTIILGAVEIAHGAVQELQERGISMDDKAKVALVSNLLTVICSDRDAQPIVPLGN
eukprot:TRINITY_DN439_c0_g1_i2.p1 TRINITY_DN439_c0_g1~~TRINITY_DN439_c0_g1_i2.p1  ORF type:complete len:275 (+),score=100.51 TRINITY_DN439_c0_g1_i2:273-1097(+)